MVNGAGVLHGDVVQSLVMNKDRSVKEKEMFRMLLTLDLIFMPIIADHHISLSVLHRSSGNDTIYIMDSMNSPPGRNKNIIEASRTN